MAAALSAQYGHPPGELLQLALDCVQYTSLPRDGELDGQRAGELSKLRKLANVYNSYHSMHNTSLDQQKWSERNAGMWAIVAQVERLKVKLNG